VLPVCLSVSVLQTAYVDHLSVLSALCHTLHDVSSADLSLAQNLPTAELQVHTRPCVCMDLVDCSAHVHIA
jgi:hypothetical protein